MEKFLVKLQRKSLNHLEDRVVWAEAKDGRFIVKRLYHTMVGDGIEAFASKVI